MKCGLWCWKSRSIRILYQIIVTILIKRGCLLLGHFAVIDPASLFACFSLSNRLYYNRPRLLTLLNICQHVESGGPATEVILTQSQDLLPSHFNNTVAKDEFHTAGSLRHYRLSRNILNCNCGKVKSSENSTSSSRCFLSFRALSLKGHGNSLQSDNCPVVLLLSRLPSSPRCDRTATSCDVQNETAVS